LKSNAKLANFLFGEMVKWTEIVGTSIRINPSTGMVELQGDAGAITLPILEERIAGLGFNVNNRKGNPAARKTWPK
jgi:hypothetical protein